MKCNYCRREATHVLVIDDKAVDSFCCQCADDFSAPLNKDFQIVTIKAHERYQEVMNSIK